MDKKVETFLLELRNLNNYKNKLKELEDKLDALFYDLTGVKAVRYDLVKGMSDYQQIELNRLGLIDEYNERSTQINEDLDRLKKNIAYIESILNKLDSKTRAACIKIYCEKKAYKIVAKTFGFSKSGLHYVIEKNLSRLL